jgi:hypothetical protein
MRAFVVRGFGEKAGVNFDWVHDQLIGPALERVGLEGGTTGLIVEAGNVRDDVIHELVMADVVVADVSIHNANVFYELGIRHAVRNRATVLIRARVDEVPFDLRGERYLSYDQADPAAAVPRLVQVLQETLASERVDSPVLQYLPGLAAGNRVALLELPRDLEEDIGQARERKWAGDLRLIAEEVVGLRFEEAALRAVAQASADVGDDVGAKQAWEKIRAAHPDDLQANRALSDIYRRLGDLVASDQAIGRALSGAALGARDRAELYSLRASNSKRRWAEQWRREGEPAVRMRVALRSRELESSLQSYRRGFEEDLNHWYSGLNALAMGKIILELAARDLRAWQTRFDSDEDADGELRRLKLDVAWLTSTVRASLDTERIRSRRHGTTDPWMEISVADLRFLTSDDLERVGAAYEAAMSPALSQATIRSIRDQVTMYRDLGILAENATVTLAALPPADAEGTAKIHPLVFAGHTVDAPGRSRPRFPPDQEGVARHAIRAKVTEIKAGVEKEQRGEVIGIAGASDGGDLLFHEVCHELGIKTHVLLPVPELIYRATALSRQAARWTERYHAALRRADEVRILARSNTMPGWLATRPDYDIWQRSNRWTLHHAWATTTTDRVSVLALWNGQVPNYYKGGVADMVDTAQHRSAAVVTLDTVALFKLSEAPGDEPCETHVPSGDATDLTKAPTGDPQPPTPAAAEQVGPLGGSADAPITAAEPNSSDHTAAQDETNQND